MLQYVLHIVNFYWLMAPPKWNTVLPLDAFQFEKMTYYFLFIIRFGAEPIISCEKRLIIFYLISFCKNQLIKTTYFFVIYHLNSDVLVYLKKSHNTKSQHLKKQHKNSLETCFSSFSTILV